MNRFAKTFRDLDVYQNAMRLAVDIHNFAKTLPQLERYALADQIRRSTRSVCANIAEAWRKKRYKGAFIAKLSDAEAEASETQSWLDIARALNYMREPDYVKLDGEYEKVISQIVSMIRSADKWCFES